MLKLPIFLLFFYNLFGSIPNLGMSLHWLMYLSLFYKNFVYSLFLRKIQMYIKVEEEG